MYLKTNGHLKNENGLYSIVLSTKINGTRKWFQWATGLKVKGNKTLATHLLNIVMQNFIPPNDESHYKQERERIRIILFDAILNENLINKVSTSMKTKILKYKETILTEDSKRSINLPIENLLNNSDDKKLIPRETYQWLFNTDSQTNQSAENISDENVYYIYCGNDMEDVKITKDTPFYYYLEIYMQYVLKQQLKIHTFEKAFAVIKYRDIPYFKNIQIKLKDMNSKILAYYYEQMKKGYTLDSKEFKPVKYTTVSSHHYYIKRSLDFAVERGIIHNNPANHIKLPNEKVFTQKDTYTIDELRKLFEIIHGRTCEYVVIMAAYYGMRRNEILGLKWTDIDFKKKLFRIRRGAHYTRVDDVFQIYISESTKAESSVRTLPLIPHIEKMLLHIQEETARNRKLFKDQYSLKYKEYIFVDQYGQLRSPETVSKNFKNLVIGNNLHYISLHNLRHTIGTLLAEENMNLEKIRIWLGHSDITTTSRYYLHANYKVQIDTSKVIESIMPKFSDDYFELNDLKISINNSVIHINNRGQLKEKKIKLCKSQYSGNINSQCFF